MEPATLWFLFWAIAITNVVVAFLYMKILGLEDEIQAFKELLKEA